MEVDSQEKNPYVGPRPFYPQDSESFFGRDNEVSELLSLITAHRVVLLYAQSGAGKTSLLNARLIPLLTEEEFEVIPPARVQGLVPVDIELEEMQNIYIFNVLMSCAEDEVDTKRLTKMPLADFLGERRHILDEDEFPLPRVIIFDQFEELFTAYPERWTDREGFFKQIRDALDEDPLLRVVFVMREDYIAQLDPHASFLPERLQTRFRLEHLRKDVALLAITRPLENTRRSFSEGVADELVQNLMEVRGETDSDGNTIAATGEFVEPVQLQVVCQSLWEDLPSGVTVITQQHLKDFGDVTLALSQFYERSIYRATEETDVKEGELRRWFGSELITPAGTRGTIYRGEQETGGIPNTTVDLLDNLHILREELRSGSRWYELTHDRLIEPIQESNRKWESERSGAVQVLQRFEDKAADWARMGRGDEGLLNETELPEAERWLRTPEAAELDISDTLIALVQTSRSVIDAAVAEEQKRSIRRFRRLSVWLVIACICALIAGGLAVLNLSSERTQRELAEKASTEAKRQEGIAKDQAELAEKQKGIAETESKRATDQATLAEERRIQAEEAGAEAKRQEQIAKDQAALAEERRKEAEKQKGIAESESQRATEQAVLAEDRRKEAEKQKGIAEAESKRATEQAALAEDRRKEAEKQKGIAEAESKRATEQAALAEERRIEAETAGAEAKKQEGIAKVQAALAEEQWQIILTRNLATQANLLTQESDQVRILLAVESVKRDHDSLENIQILRERLTKFATDKAVTAVRMEHKSYVYSISFSPDGKHLATVSNDNIARVWDVTSGREVTQIPHGSDLNSIAFSHPDGRFLATAGMDGFARVWEVATKELIVSIDHKADVNFVVFSPDGKSLATASIDGYGRVWNLSNSQEIFSTTQVGEVTSVSFGLDGKYFAMACNDKKAWVWEISSGQQLASVDHEEGVSFINFSPDGKYVATASKDDIARIRKLSNEQEIAFTDHEDDIYSVCFSSDGKYLAAASKDKTARIWEISRELEVSLMNHQKEVYSVSFSPDDKYLATGGQDGVVRVWLLDPEDLVNKAREHLSRNLTKAEWDKFVGKEEPYRKTFEDLPGPAE